MTQETVKLLIESTFGAIALIALLVFMYKLMTKE